MKKTIITIALVAIATVILLFCFRYVSGAQELSLSEAELTLQTQASGASSDDKTTNTLSKAEAQHEKQSEASKHEAGEVDLRAEEIKIYIKERIIPVVVGVLTSLSAVLASLGAIKKSLSRLSGARDDFKNEANERKSEFARQSALLEAKAQELSELARLIPQLELELSELKASQKKLNREAYNIGKMISLGFSGSQSVVKSGNGRKIAALLGECRALSGKRDGEGEEAGDLCTQASEGDSSSSSYSEKPTAQNVKSSRKERKAVKNEEN